jgi:hypothetical protein
MANAQIGQPYGRTSYSPYADHYYEQARNKRKELSASEYAVVVVGFLREFVCMGQ